MFSRRTKEERKKAHDHVVALCRNCLATGYGVTEILRYKREREYGHTRN